MHVRTHWCVSLCLEIYVNFSVCSLTCIIYPSVLLSTPTTSTSFPSITSPSLSASCIFVLFSSHLICSLCVRKHPFKIQSLKGWSTAEFNGLRKTPRIRCLKSHCDSPSLSPALSLFLLPCIFLNVVYSSFMIVFFSPLSLFWHSGYFPRWWEEKMKSSNLNSWWSERSRVILGRKFPLRSIEALHEEMIGIVMETPVRGCEGVRVCGGVMIDFNC